MKVLNIVENTDGSANVELEMTDEEQLLLIQEGFTSLLLKSLQAEEQRLKKKDSEET